MCDSKLTIGDFNLSLSDFLSGCYITYNEAPDKNMCYEIVEQPENWYTARANCLKTGGDLISINSAADLTWVQSGLLQGMHKSKALQCPFSGLVSEEIYIGFNDVYIETDWVWSDGGPTTYHPPWFASNPDNSGPTSNEDCAILRTDGTMNDVDCASIAPYICEMRKLKNQFIISCAIWSTWICF